MSWELEKLSNIPSSQPMIKESQDVRRLQSWLSIPKWRKTLSFTSTVQILAYSRTHALEQFELYVQGSYQNVLQEILTAANISRDRNANYFKEQVQNLLSNIFPKEEWSYMAGYLQTCTKLTSMTTNHLYNWFPHPIDSTKPLPNDPPALFSKEEQKPIFLWMFPNQWVKNFASSQESTSDKTALQSIKCYIWKQESLDPYQDKDDQKDDQKMIRKMIKKIKKRIKKNIKKKMTTKILKAILLTKKTKMIIPPLFNLPTLKF
jgi:hypothetical protein